jgi:drug/metabolite transporter (DMT)-like permease
MSLQAVPYIILLGFIYGTSIIASAFNVGQFEPATYIGLRLMLAGLVYAALYPVMRSRRWPTDRQLLRHSIVLGIFGTAIPMTAFVLALQYQSGGITALLITVGPALTVLMAHIFLEDESLTATKAAGAALALGGAAMLALRGESGLEDVNRANPIGYALVLMAMTVSSAMTIYARRHMRNMDAFDVASVRILTAGLVVLPLSFLFVGFDLSAVTSQGYFALIYAALVGTFLAFFLSFYNIKRFGATASAMTSYIVPVVTGIGGVLLLGERITPAMLLGMGVIVSGVALINRSGRSQRREMRA